MNSQSTPSSPPSKLWPCLIPAVSLPLLASLVYFVLLSDSPAGQAIYSATKVFTLVWPVVCVVCIWKERQSLAIRFSNSRHWNALPLGVLSGLLIVGAMIALLQVSAIQQVLEESTPAIQAKAEGLGFAEHYLLFAVFLSVFHSLIEEYYWRWFVYGNLRRGMARPWLAHLLAAVSFAAHHLVITAQFFPFWFAIILTILVGAGGAIWSWLYQKQETLAGAWISHLIVDAGIMWVGYGLIF